MYTYPILSIQWKKFNSFYFFPLRIKLQIFLQDECVEFALNYIKNNNIICTLCMYEHPFVSFIHSDNYLNNQAFPFKHELNGLYDKKYLDYRTTN